MKSLEYTVLCPFGGSGGGALGFLAAEARLLGHVGRFRCLGSIDFDALACEDFARFTKSDAWHVDIETVSGAQLVERYGNKAPDVVFMSPPCKGSSRLLSSKKAATEKYVAMNKLALVWTRAMLAAWGDSPPALVLLENVPGLPTRAASMLRELRSLLKRAGYVFHASTHDCGEIGGLAQHRQRYLLVARHPKKCPSLLYQPPKRRVRGVGEVLGELPMPATVGAQRWGALHTMPRLSWRNWLRLALIPAGGDWRDLAGVLAEGQARREVFRRHPVQAWDAAAPAITGPGGHSLEGIADPRVTCTPRAGAYGVTGWDDPSGTVIGSGSIDNARTAVADPRIAMAPSENRHWNKLDVLDWTDPAHTVIGKEGPSNGGPSVADPRIAMNARPGNWSTFGVSAWDEPSATVAGQTAPSNGRYSVADPRVSVGFDAAYAVLGWDQPARTVAGTPAVGCGAYSVADPRDRELLDARVMTLDEAMVLDLDAGKPPPFTPVIVAADGTWHRPLTLLELSALQGFPTEIDGQPIMWSGGRTGIAEHIGNSVPPPAARAIAERMLVALVEASVGAMSLSSGAVWVRPDARGALA